MKVLLFNAPKLAGKNTLLNEVIYNNPTKVFIDASCKIPLIDSVCDFFTLDKDKFLAIYNNREFKETPLSTFRLHLDLRSYNKLAKIVKLPPVDEILDSYEDVLAARYPNRNFEIIPQNKDKFKTGLNLSVREAMIFVSEVYLKPLFGKDVFGYRRYHQIIKPKLKALNFENTDKLVFFDDSAASFDNGKNTSELDELLANISKRDILLIKIEGRGSFEGDSRGFIPSTKFENILVLDNSGDEEAFLKDGIIKISKFLKEGA